MLHQAIKMDRKEDGIGEIDGGEGCVRYVRFVHGAWDRTRCLLRKPLFLHPASGQTYCYSQDGYREITMFQKVIR